MIFHGGHYIASSAERDEVLLTQGRSFLEGLRPLNKTGGRRTSRPPSQGLGYKCRSNLNLIQGKIRLLDENALQGHGMAAAIPGLEKITIALPLAIFKKDLVRVILSLEGNRKRIDLDPFPFGGI